MSPLSLSFDPLAELPEELQFAGGRGERCLRLFEAWPTLFEHLNRLGPVVIGSQTGPITVLMRQETLDFQWVPGSHEIVDLASDWVVDTSHLASVVAVDESCSDRSRILGLQFFNHEQEGIFKIMLTEASSCWEFTHLLHGFARGGFLPEPQQAKTLEQALRGPNQGQPVGVCRLIKSLLMAHHKGVPLKFTVYQSGQVRSVSILPRRLERCGNDFLLSGVNAEVHLADVPGYDLMCESSRRGKDSLPILSFSLGHGRRCEVSFAGDESQLALWEALHSFGSGFCNG